MCAHISHKIFVLSEKNVPCNFENNVKTFVLCLMGVYTSNLKLFYVLEKYWVDSINVWWKSAFSQKSCSFSYTSPKSECWDLFSKIWTPPSPNRDFQFCKTIWEFFTDLYPLKRLCFEISIEEHMFPKKWFFSQNTLETLCFLVRFWFLKKKIIFLLFLL